MRKSFQKSKKKLQKEEKRKKVYMLGMTGFFIFILVFSLFAYALIYSPESAQNSNAIEEYGQSFKATQVEGGYAYTTNFDGKEPLFIRLPSEVAGYYSEEEALSRFVDAPIATLTFDPQALDEQLARITLSQFNDIQDQKVIVYATTKQSDTFQTPIITCENATSFAPVVYFGITNESDQSGILLQDDCVTVQAFTAQDLILMTEKIRYAQYGIDFSVVE